MSYLFHALMICFSTIYIRSTQHYKPQNAAVIRCQIICFQSIESLFVSLNDSWASNCNLLRKKSTHCHSLCIHKVAYIFLSQWHKGTLRYLKASTWQLILYSELGKISRHLNADNIFLLLSLCRCAPSFWIWLASCSVRASRAKMKNQKLSFWFTTILHP